MITENNPEGLEVSPHTEVLLQSGLIRAIDYLQNNSPTLDQLTHLAGGEPNPE